MDLVELAWLVCNTVFVFLVMMFCVLLALKNKRINCEGKEELTPSKRGNGFDKKVERFVARQNELAEKFTSVSIQIPPKPVPDDISKMAEAQLRTESLEKVKFLIDYSKFHIGLYSAIAVILVTGITTNASFTSATTLLKVVSIGAVISYTLAGFIGGLILSNLIHYTDISIFKGSFLRLGHLEIGRYKSFQAAQYILFWSATLILLGTLIVHTYTHGEKYPMPPY